MSMLRTSVAGLALVAAAVALAAESDPWIVTVPSGSDVMMTLATSSKHAYAVNPADKPWADASGPERAEPALSKEEKDGLAACRDLVAKGDHDGAAKAIDDLLAKNPANWDAHLLRASSLHARAMDKDAVAPLRTSLVGNRRSPEAWRLLADVAKALAKKVVRPTLDLRGWVREKSKTQIEVGGVFLKDADMPWTYYAGARALYRYEGNFGRDFPAAKSYAFTFREQMFAMCVLAQEAETQRKDGAANAADLKLVLAEKKAGTLTPFTFFAVYPEPVPATPEPGFDALRPRLEKYFDEKVLVRR